MRIRIIEVGKTKDSYISQGVSEYLKILSPYAQVEIVDVKAEKTVELEAEKILKQIKEDNFVVALDENGKQFSSIEFADEMKKFKDSGQSIVFVIGGAFGLGDAVKKRANLVLSFSKMTFTHQMIRLILLEQIYRAVCIILGKEYHHN